MTIRELRELIDKMPNENLDNLVFIDNEFNNILAFVLEGKIDKIGDLILTSNQ